MRILLFAVLFLTAFRSENAAGQDSALDAQTKSRHWFPPKLGKYTWLPLVGFDIQRSWLKGKFIKVNGLLVGVTYRGIHRIGAGFHWMKRGVEYSGMTIDAPDALLDGAVKFDTRFVSAFYERIVYRSHRWNISVPLAFSYGQIRGYYETTEDGFSKFNDSPYSAASTGIHTKLYLMTWLMPRFNIGYRYTFNTTKEVKQAFDSFYFSWGISVSPVHLYRRLKSHHDAGISIFDPRPI